MREYEYFLFDLDGTITDPGIGITNSVMYALEKYQIRVKERSELYPFIGPPLADSFMRFFGFDEAQSREAIGYYREYYVPRGMYENQVYDGVPELLRTLKEDGKKVILATSKPEEFAVRILRHFRLLPYFDCVAGASMDETVVTKVDVMNIALERADVKEPARALMVGDREYDILGAKHFGMDSAGAAYGYGSREELREAGADYIIDCPTDLLTCLAQG